MKLLFINQYYWPDAAATAQMLTDLCEHLAAAGHDVHVIASRKGYAAGSSASATAGQRTPLHPRREIRNGVHISRIPATGFGNRRFFHQFLDFLSFHFMLAMKTLLVGWRYDVVVTLTTPPLVGLYVTPLKMLGLTRQVCWVMDLHPDCEFELGIFDPRSPLPRALNWLNTLHFKTADACVSLGSCMTRRLVAKGIDPKKITDIPVWGHDPKPNGSPVLTPSPDPHDNPLRRDLGLTDKFVVMYSGNAGMPHTFDELCEAALALRDDSRFRFLFIGGGRRLASVSEFKEKHSLDSIRLRGYLPREQLRYSLTLPDVHFVSLRGNLAGVSVPCKLYGVMAAARPALFVGPASCESADAIRTYDCGRALPAGEPASLITALKELANNPALCQTLGQNARRAFEQTYNPTSCSTRWQTLLESLAPRSHSNR